LIKGLLFRVEGLWFMVWGFGFRDPGLLMAHAGVGAIQGTLEIKDTHRPRTLRWFPAQENTTFLGAVRVLNFESRLYPHNALHCTGVPRP
jgi:hypothetical protein